MVVLIMLSRKERVFFMKKSRKKTLAFLLAVISFANLSPAVYAESNEPAKLEADTDDAVVSSCILGYETPEEYLENAISLLENRNDIWCLSYNTYVNPVPEIPSAETGTLYGDADGSGIITANDAAVILNAVRMGTEASEEDIINNYDVDFSGILTANDASTVLYKVLNNDYALPVEIEVNREIKPKSCVISLWEDRSIINNHFSMNEDSSIFEIKSKADLDTFTDKLPQVNKEAFLERIYSEFGVNALANQNIIVACTISPDPYSIYDVKDISVSDGALCITMDDIFPGLQHPVEDSRMIVVSVGKNTEYDSVRFIVNNYHGIADTEDIVFDDTEVWE